MDSSPSRWSSRSNGSNAHEPEPRQTQRGQRKKEKRDGREEKRRDEGRKGLVSCELRVARARGGPRNGEAFIYCITPPMKIQINHSANDTNLSIILLKLKLRVHLSATSSDPFAYYCCRRRRRLRLVEATTDTRLKRQHGRSAGKGRGGGGGRTNGRTDGRIVFNNIQELSIFVL